MAVTLARIPEPRDFEAAVEGWLVEALACGPKCFDELVTLLPGVYPAVVLGALRRLVSCGNAPSWLLEDAIKEVPSNPGDSSFSARQRPLPVPHPLDYDWRFGSRAIEYLLAEALRYTSPGERVALIGAPSLFVAAAERSYPREVRLLDANPTVTDRLARGALDEQVVRCDVLHDVLPRLSAKVVVIDPPWYEDHIRSFLWAAVQLCMMEGHIIVSVPPVGTRPGMAQEWRRILKWAHQLGLTLTREEPAVLPYLSPPFERNALRVDGLHGVALEWRCGNLAVFTRIRLKGARRPVVPAADTWDEQTYFGVRVRLRQRREIGFEDPALLSIVPGDVLPSVSRRDPRRRLADVWTSGNRVFACRGLAVLGLVARALVDGVSSAESVATGLGQRLTLRDVNLVRRAAQQLMRVVDLEREEYARLEHN